MQIYLVGGAVRDQLLGMPIKERDWVVVGATPAEMIALGYRAVGKDFPVFLHPTTNEEYALARTERKVGKGYKGFTFHADPSVSLTEDLVRRDLTINAIAQDANGNLIDPYNGKLDIEQQTLRHVSPAFSEDPVRILRLARFAAKFPDFTIHTNTLRLMQQMVENGEVDALVPERVWQELHKALHSKNPCLFFKTLEEGNALGTLFPEISSTGDGMEALRQAIIAKKPPTVQLACLLHDVGEKNVRKLVQRYRIPKQFSDIAILTSRYFSTYNTLTHAPAALLGFILNADAIRRPARFNLLLEALIICAKDSTRKNASLISNSIHAIKSINLDTLKAQNLAGKKFADGIKQLRLTAIAKLIEK